MADKIPVKAKYAGTDVVALQEFEPTDTIPLALISGFPAGVTSELANNSIVALSDVLTSMTPTDGQVLTFDTTNGWQAESPVPGITDHTLLSNIGTNTHAQIDSHIGDSSIHFTQAAISITESQISDLQTYILASEKGAANGVATLGADSKIPTSQLPALAITSTYVVASEVAQLALTVQEGDVAVRSDLNKSYIALNDTNATMADWQILLTPTDAVLSVDGLTGAVDLSTIYEPIDGTILKDADIGVTVQAYNPTILVDADIGVTVAAQSSLATKLSLDGSTTMTGVVDTDVGTFNSNVVSASSSVAYKFNTSLDTLSATNSKLFAFSNNGTELFSLKKIAGAGNYFAKLNAVVCDFGKDNTVTSGVCFGTLNTSASTNSLCVGQSNQTSSSFAVALGYDNAATGNGNVAMGLSNKIGGFYSVGLGSSNETQGFSCLVLGSGNKSNSTFFNTSLIGGNNTANGSASQATALGYLNTISGTASLAVGASNISSGFYSGAIGYQNTATGQQSHAIGMFNTVSGNLSVGLGYSNIVTGQNSVSTGYANDLSGANSINCGWGLDTTTDYSATFGLGYDQVAGQKLLNNISGAMMFGMWSNLPTMTLRPDGAGGVGTIGKVGIGITAPTERVTISGNLNLLTDSDKIIFGTGKDASIYYDGTNLVVNPKVVGTGKLTVLGAVTATGGVDSLTSATTTVNVAAATAPTTGQVLQATSGTAATWQTLPAASVFGTQFQEASSDALSITTASTFQQKLRMTTPSLPSGKYRIGYSYEWNLEGSTSQDFQGQVQINDTITIAAHKEEPKDSGNLQYRDFGGYYYHTGSGVLNIDIDYSRSATQGSAYIRRARLEIWRVS